MKNRATSVLLSTDHCKLPTFLPAIFCRAVVCLVIGDDLVAWRSQCINALEVLFAQAHASRAEVIFKLLHGARADDGRGNARLGVAPGQRHLADGLAHVLRNLFQQLDHVKRSRGKVLLAPLIELGEARFGGRSAPR
jgi:hypothetical protein